MRKTCQAACHALRFDRSFCRGLLAPPWEFGGVLAGAAEVVEGRLSRREVSESEQTLPRFLSPVLQGHRFEFVSRSGRLLAHRHSLSYIPSQN
jgi:hypothetical protein